ncbi:hypothetical protein ACXNSR_38565 [Streptomyces sp. NC-S4]
MLRTVDLDRIAARTARDLLPTMPLLMLDLDNTLIDCDTALRPAVAALLVEHRLPDTDLTWVMNIDVGGCTPGRRSRRP